MTQDKMLRIAKCDNCSYGSDCADILPWTLWFYCIRKSMKVIDKNGYCENYKKRTALH